ncbi:MAG: hypothetical protein QNL62_01140 [Gammaproteobacteria bacterium]|nr:hypothetical protein [Gammaproteobacteria bacterium]
MTDSVERTTKKKFRNFNLTRRLYIAVFLLFSYLLGACSVQTVNTDVSNYPVVSPEMLSRSVVESPHYWWYARFKMVWQKELDSIDFSSNLIIAHQIINPVLENHHQDIKLWRFHRRAAKDSAGHQFSFIFYATAESARKIFQQINSNPISAKLINENIVGKIHLDDPDKPKRPGIEDSSDKNWPVAIQKSWPYYIMGVSILWLDLLNQQAIQEKLDVSRAITSQQEQYKKINEKITQQWKSQGKHAYFHHISGIFGYEPLEIRY